MARKKANVESREEVERRITEEFLACIWKSPTAYQAAAYFAGELEEAGFTELREQDEWKLEAGGAYFVRRSDSALIAFRVPAKAVDSVHIAAAHLDSPLLKIKGEQPELTEKGYYKKLNVEVYGGVLLNPWFDRPLSVAGRLVVRDEKAPEGIRTLLVDVDRDLLLIPSVCIHMDREANKGKELNPQVDVLPLLAEDAPQAAAGADQAAPKSLLLGIVAEKAGVKAEDILGHDLYVYNRAPGSIWGAHDEFFSCPRIDDMQCAFAACRGLIAAGTGKKKNGVLAIAALFDNEEIGSETKQGADSTFLTQVMKRIRSELKMGEQQLMTAIARGFMISADNAHALHPNHPELHDPVNRPRMNGGPVVKFAANMSYASDAVSGALFKELCKAVDVPYQEFYNRSDKRGGGTLGGISNTHVSIRTVDIGLPQLAMHSPYETAGVKDTEYLIRVLTRFFGSEL